VSLPLAQVGVDVQGDIEVNREPAGGRFSLTTAVIGVLHQLITRVVLRLSLTTVPWWGRVSRLALHLIFLLRFWLCHLVL